MRPEAIDRLCRLVGIPSGYRDAFGDRIEVGAGRRAAMLSHLGFPADTDQAAAESTARAEALRGRILPRSVPALAGQEVPLTIAGGGETASWRLTDETGRVREGRAPIVEGRLALPALPAGYHDLSLAIDGAQADTTIIAAPGRAWQPGWMGDEGRAWGLSAQIYGLRSDRDLGIGGYGEVKTAVEGAGRLGAAFLGLSPVHALFGADRTKVSPYSPSSRLFLETIHIDPRALPGFAGSRAAARLDEPGRAGRIAALRALPLVDHAGVWAELAPVLEAYFAERRDGLAPDLAAFRREMGPALEAHAGFEALSEHFRREGRGWLGDWPAEFRRSGTSDVQAFARDHAERIAFHAWLQKAADDQLAAAHRAARESGMRLGLYRDLAVGSDRDGSELWSAPDLYGQTLSIGAPPDLLAPQGQDWGLPPVHPLMLQATGLAAFRALVRANLRHAGAIRIDHAFQLRRLYLMPVGASGSDGAYVDYPFEAMLAVLRLESHRAEALVIAEDLGTAPEGFSDAIMASGILSYRVLAFERDHDGGFKPPSAYPRNAMAVISTHDLPTLSGWWRGLDTDLRQSLGIYDAAHAEQERVSRMRERASLVAALAAEGVMPGDPARSKAPSTEDDAPSEAVIRYLARTPSALMAVQYEDVLGALDQANVPGTTEGHPNWRRKLGADLAAIDAPGGPLARIAAALAAEGRAPPPDDRSGGLRWTGAFRHPTRCSPEENCMTAPVRPPKSLDLTEPASPAIAPAATGPRIYNLFPLLVGPVSAWIAELPRIAAMGFDWVYVNPFHESGFSGSLYAIRDPEKLDPRFHENRDGDESGDLAIHRFTEAAASHGLRVMADLVINHASKDAVMASTAPEAFLRNMWGELESPFATDPGNPGKRTIWGDLAEFDWHGEASRTHLLAYWDRYLARMQRLGIAGFRCDAAYKVPPEVWRDLIGRAKARDPGCLFAAETLGCSEAETAATARAGFDYLFNSFAWWDLKQPWALDLQEANRLLAPSIAFPENHDMDRLAAALPAEERDRIARDLTLRYALAAFFSSGVLMPIGYEWGYRGKLHVVETNPGHREETGIDISGRIAAINRLKAGIGAANIEGATQLLSAPDAPYVALLRLDSGHAVSAASGLIVLANPGQESVTLDPAAILTRTGGVLGPFLDRTPDQVPAIVEPGRPLVLPPGEFRILTAERAAAGIRPESEPTGEGRVVIEAIWPELDGGATPIKRVVGDVVEVWADIFSDGHDRIAAEILYRPWDEAGWRRAPMRAVDNDRWRGAFPLERNTRYLYLIEGWRDPFASWHHEVEAKRAAGIDVSLETIEGARIAERAAQEAEGVDGEALRELVVKLERAGAGTPEQLALILDHENEALIGRNAERMNASRSRELVVIADRLAARYSAWYELFPRSMSHDASRHGTFDDVIAMLPYVRGMGFDVLYFPPIHPVGLKNRKGKNNALKAEPGDVGSVYAIGDETGGHDAVHPDLGGIEAFRRLVAAANGHGLEIALDFAIQCSPDHPWIRQHPDWFEYRPDGTMKYAENPPKKYEDIYNVTFYGASKPGLWHALRDAVLFWCREGVRIFRVDNPHTKPLPFWEWLIAEVNGAYPDAIFLAEAFTRPKMMRQLAKIGFQQSYTYFTWRDTKHELTEYMTELAHSEMGEYYRPNFFTNTPDINPIYLQTSGRAGFVVRATLAATLSSSYGIYNGFELCEAALFRKEEYLDSEKYEIRVWDYDRPGNIREHITKLNAIRRRNPALWDFRTITFLNAWNDRIIAYLRMTPAKDNALLILVNLDPHNRQDCTYEVPLWEFGLPDDAAIGVEDLLGGGRFELRGKTHRIALDPADRSCIIWRLTPPGRP